MSAVTLRAHRDDAQVGHSSRATLWQARIVCLSAFGPYVAAGARTEQIVVFALAAWVLITAPASLSQPTLALKL